MAGSLRNSSVKRRALITSRQRRSAARSARHHALLASTRTNPHKPAATVGEGVGPAGGAGASPADNDDLNEREAVPAAGALAVATTASKHSRPPSSASTSSASSPLCTSSEPRVPGVPSSWGSSLPPLVQHGKGPEKKHGKGLLAGFLLK